MALAGGRCATTIHSAVLDNEGTVMMVLKRGDTGSQVRLMQKLLAARGYVVDCSGEFDIATLKAVRAYQSQNLDPRGQPLAVDGVVGPLTSWSLNNPKPFIKSPRAVDYSVLPPAGGSKRGRAALAQAIEELNAGAGEVGGDNRGSFVKKYVTPGGGSEGDSWCAAFVSYCFLKAADGNATSMPFEYTLSARDILSQLEAKGWAERKLGIKVPGPGDLVVWWRGAASGWKGHIGFVHSAQDGILYTIEGNRSPRVQGFSYVLSRMQQLLGFCHVQ
jgi:hypothetical protein